MSTTDTTFRTYLFSRNLLSDDVRCTFLTSFISVFNQKMRNVMLLFIFAVILSRDLSKALPAEVYLLLKNKLKLICMIML